MAWDEYRFDVNGFEVRARYRAKTVEGVFVPWLARLTQLQLKRGGRLIAYLAAPPATGKTTLCRLLEHLSREREGLGALKAVGIDGFHYHASYLDTHEAVVADRRVLMREVKGCPETYDTARLAKALRELAQGGPTPWPSYSRTIHDVIEDAEIVTAQIVLVEGNWLLLNEEPWRSLCAYASHTTLVRADEGMLAHRLVERKVRGGLTREEAEEWYVRSDGPNVRRTLDHSVPGDLNLTLDAEGDYVPA